MAMFYKPRTRKGEPLPPMAERLSALRYLPPFLRMVWATRPLYALAVLAFRLVNAFTPVVLLWIGKLIIDGVVANIGAAAADWGRLAELVALELGVALLGDALTRAASYYEALIGDLFSNEMSVRIMRHAATLDLEQFENPEFHDKLQRARRQTMGRVALLGQVLGMGQQLITLVSLLAALVAFNPWLLVILVVAIVPSFLGETHYAGIGYSFMFQWTQQRRELDYLRYVATDQLAAKEVKLFGLSDWFTDRFAKLADDYVRENRRIAVHRAITGGVLTALSTLAYYGAFAFIIAQTVLGIITIGTLTFLIGSFQRSRGLIQSVLLGTAGLYEQSLFLKDLFDFLAMEPAVASKAGALLVPRPIVSGFVFEDVGFRYPEQERWALRGVSFRIALAERIALVGENGAGKTTLVKLLTRLYDPSEGRITLDGRDLRDYDLDSLRQAVGVIFQDFFRYDLTARENIAVGWIDAREDQQRIVDSAQKSLAADVVAGLDRRYDHVLGRRFDGGANLSGGEWQKVALARAYMRDAQVLVLDEPTAALDARAEYQVFQRFSELTSGRMAVLISHRFSTVRMADRILVFERGAVLEDGSHEQLLALGGRYAELFNLQAAGYR
jgi:ATP-binding cassette, subfamily B, bacterial